MTVRHLLAIALSVMGLLLTSPLEAQEQTEPGEDIVKLNREGIAAFKRKDYAQAATLFDRAYALHPEPNLLKNQAVAWFRAKKYDRARSAASRFLLASTTTESDRREARKIVSRCLVERADNEPPERAHSTLLRAYDIAPDEATREVVLAKLDALKLREGIEPLLSRESPPTPVAQADTASDQGWADRSTAAWLTSAVGVGILLTAVAYHLHARSAEGEFIDAWRRGDRQRHGELASTLETASWLAPALYTLGAATLGVGLYLHVDPFSLFSSEASAASDLAPRGPTAQVGLRWRF